VSPVPETGNAFTCSRLAASLADEWIELHEAARFSAGSNRRYRQAIEAFCTHVDATVPRPATASLARAEPDLHYALTEWIRLLPATRRAGSRLRALPGS
jgi:hypothetical protein